MPSVNFVSQLLSHFQASPSPSEVALPSPSTTNPTSGKEPHWTPKPLKKSAKNNLQEQLTAHIPACSVSSLLFLNTSGSACNIFTWPRTLSLRMQANFCSACNISTPPRTFSLSLQHFHSAKKMEDKGYQWNLFVVWQIIVRIITQGLQHGSNGCHLRNYCLTNLS